MKNTLPVMLLKNLLILPNQEVKLELNNDNSRNVVLLATENYRNQVVVLTPVDQMEEIPEVSDLPKVAVVAKVKSKLELPNGNLRVTLRGMFRVQCTQFQNHEKYPAILECKYQKLAIPPFNEVEALAIRRKLSSLMEMYVSNGQGISNSIIGVMKDAKDLNKFTDVIAAFLPISFLKRLSYIEEINPVLRGKGLMEDVSLELEVIKLDQKLDQKLQTGLEESQKEFILKERLKSIQEELGESDNKEKEVSSYYARLEDLHLTNERIDRKIREEIKKFAYTSEMSPELANIRNYLDWMFSLPWHIHSQDENDLEKIAKSLDQTHYGMQKAKDKILEYIVAQKRNPDVDSPILCLIGPSGVGKTTFAKSIAQSLHKAFYKISVGGLNDSSVLVGHRRTYLGANPGKIMEALRRSGTNNPLILIDEVDKMVKDYRGDPASALLDILDKSQNKTFVDHYIEEEYDLSHVLFVMTANYVQDIPYELKDRLEVVELSSYTLFEKLEIAKKYLLPDIYKAHHLAKKDIKFSDNLLKEIILEYTSEAGVRDLSRVLTSIVRKILVMGSTTDVKVTSTLLKELLGEGEYKKDYFISTALPGVVNALGVYANEGKVLRIESTFYEGNGKIKITGCAELVMRESIEVAVSYILTNKQQFWVEAYPFKENDLHIHLLEAAMKKDGPSAGVAITTALISLGRNIPISSKIAMTGEITLKGYVKKIGGLKEKLIGAYNEGIEKVFIPRENHNQLGELPKEVLETLEIIEVDNYIDIYQALFD